VAQVHSKLKKLSSLKLLNPFISALVFSLVHNWWTHQIQGLITSI